MTTNQAGLRAVLREITHSADRSSLFWWMVEHHDDLRDAAQGRRLQWAPLCARFAELGLTDATGKPASVRTARETWKRARHAVRDARRARAAHPLPAPGSRPPSRLPSNWQPPTVPPPPGPPRPAAPSATPPHSTPPHPVPAGSRSSFASPHDPPEVRAILAEVEAKLRKADGYLGLPSKRKPTDV